MIYGYIRVSTDMQTVENQRHEIERFALDNNIVIAKYIEETISGTKEYQKRLLGKLLRKLKRGDTLVVSELSRLGRSFYMVIEILNRCLSKGVDVITIKEKFHSGDNIESKVIAFAFSLCAELERNLISQRTKEALCRLKQEGKKLGRPKGSRNKSNVFIENEDRIRKYLKNGRSISFIAKKFKVHRNTISKYLKTSEKQ